MDLLQSVCKKSMYLSEGERGTGVWGSVGLRQKTIKEQAKV